VEVKDARQGSPPLGQGTVWAVILGTVILSTGHTTDREEGCPTGWSRQQRRGNLVMKLSSLEQGIVVDGNLLDHMPFRWIQFANTKNSF